MTLREVESDRQVDVVGGEAAFDGTDAAAAFVKFLRQRQAEITQAEDGAVGGSGVHVESFFRRPEGCGRVLSYCFAESGLEAV